jgi:hypothetical protein
MANLLLHMGSQIVDRDILEGVLTPRPTRSWVPIPHIDVLDGVRKTLERTGMRIVNQALGLSRDEARFFGLLEVENGARHQDYATVIGLRNSHDKTFPVGLCMGSCVLVCDNLCFSGEVTLIRRHTRFVRRDLPMLIDQAVGKLGDLRRTQDDRIDSYRAFEMTDLLVHDLVINAMDARVIGPTKLPQVLALWRKPEHVEFQDRTAWSLFNAITETLKGTNLHELSRRTQTLHGLFDNYTAVDKTDAVETTVEVESN